MKNISKRLGIAVVAVLVLLGGCGGGSSSDPSGTSGIHMKLTVPMQPRAAIRAPVLAQAAVGAEVFIDGVSVGFTDEDGEITVFLEPGTYEITVVSDGVTSTPVVVTVDTGQLIEIEVEMEDNGTLVVEVDDDDSDDDTSDDESSDDESSDDESSDDEESEEEV